MYSRVKLVDSNNLVALIKMELKRTLTIFDSQKSTSLLPPRRDNFHNFEIFVNELEKLKI